VRLIQQFQSLLEAAGPSPSHVGANGRVVVRILAIVDGAPLDFSGGSIDVVNGRLRFIVDPFAGSPAIKLGAHRAGHRERADSDN
jgi:hypothetical protein